jgi:phosphonoacetaldehyde hydrolase
LRLHIVNVLLSVGRLIVNDITNSKPYTGPVRAVVLDWAGTAVDHGCVGPVAVFIEVFKRRGVEVTTAEARGPMGLMKKDHVRAMCRTNTVTEKWRKVHGREPEENDVDAMYEEVEPLMVSSVTATAEPIPGLHETLAEFRKAGIRIGSCTGYTAPIMDVLVEEARKRGYAPDAVVCPSDVPAGRPYPWMCYQNAMKLDVFPMEAMVKIGDTVSDIQEGLNAGMWTIGVTKTGNELGLTESEVAALAPAELRRRLGVVESRLHMAGAHYLTESVASCPTLFAVINGRLARGERP